MQSQKSEQAGAFCRRTRREFLWQAGGGFIGLALAGLLDATVFRPARHSRAPQARRPARSRRRRASAQLAPKAKSVIFLFMYGGPSHVDTFDYKPKLYELDGKTIPSKPSAGAGRKTKAASSAPSGSSSNMASAASTSRTCFRIWPPAWTTSPSSTR